eukprot:958981-Amorphochlora_amoeboformis.AAC.1
MPGCVHVSHMSALDSKKDASEGIDSCMQGEELGGEEGRRIQISSRRVLGIFTTDRMCFRAGKGGDVFSKNRTRG